MSAAARLLPIRETLSGRWQVPALVVGVVLLVGGLRHMFKSHVPTSFAVEIERVHRLQAAGADARANAYLLDLLAKPERSAAERAEFHRLLAQTIYRAESDYTLHNTRNVGAIVTHFEKALRLGIALAASDWIGLGDAYRWSEQDDSAVEAYRRALEGRPAKADRVRRQLVEMQLARGSMTAELMGEVDAILADEGASAGNVVWALEQKVQALLDGGDTAAAMSLIEKARSRLAGTEERIAVRYLEALCLREAGLRGEAEQALRSLRNEWRSRDELWGKAGWLLGRLQQEDDRPQLALSFYLEVLRSFQSGELHDLCAVGRAECLAALARYERALEAFGELKERLIGKERSRALDCGVVRAAITTIGELLIQGGRLELGVDYLRLAMQLVGSDEAALRGSYLVRVAGALEEMARAAGSDAAKAQQHYAEAAGLHLERADLRTTGDAERPTALEMAADDFESAGHLQKMVDVLARLTAEFPNYPGRAGALYRLAEACRAEGRTARAIATYELVMQSYPRLPDALRSVVPLAECYLAQGGAGTQRGVELLLSVVDDAGPQPLFSPQAIEYRKSLILLADYYSRASDEEVPNHFEKAIRRLEDAVAFYPDDPEMPRLKFQLGDAYRQSAGALRAVATSQPSTQARQSGLQEVERRLARALELMEDVIAALAPHDADSLSDVEKAQLEAGYQYRGDCLFDLGRYAAAIEAYREAAWRFENRPAAVSATLQIVQCHQRLGQAQEARSTLARLGWLLKKTPASAFDERKGMRPKAYWEALVSRLEVSGAS
ncbi:MAG TPA: tetratricopeptide repeat protein [Phycisphaerae bacterium]|nr:tetratricopeptide repeat protein [Phycisphaerae bacterium]